jgi:hypothetical protein
VSAFFGMVKEMPGRCQGILNSTAPASIAAMILLVMASWTSECGLRVFMPVFPSSCRACRNGGLDAGPFAVADKRTSQQGGSSLAVTEGTLWGGGRSVLTGTRASAEPAKKEDAWQAEKEGETAE